MEKPVTNAELDEFYGVEVNEMQIAITIGATATEADANVMAEIARDNFDAIADSIYSPYAIGSIIIQARKQWIADAASTALYGKKGIIKPEDVKV